MKLEKGMLIRTNYSGPYRIKFINRSNADYIHLVCTLPDSNYTEFYLNYWIEGELRSVHKTICGNKKELDYDRIIILPNDQPVQISLC